jgi:hypothetical protein
MTEAVTPAQAGAQSSARVGVDPYLEWLGREGLPVVDDFGVDLLAVQTAPWAALRGERGGGASQGPRRLPLHAGDRHSAGQGDGAAAPSL